MHVVFDSGCRCGCTLIWTVKNLLMLTGHCSRVGSPQRSGFDWQGVLQRFRSHVDNCALLLAELEADGDSICQTAIFVQAHLILRSIIHWHMRLLAETCQTKAQAHTTVSRPLSLRVRLLERHVNLGGPVALSFFLKWPCSGVAKCSNMFQRQGMKRSTTVPTPRAAFIGKIRVWGWPGSCSWPFGQPPEKAYGYRATSLGTKGDIVAEAFSTPDQLNS